MNNALTETEKLIRDTVAIQDQQGYLIYAGDGKGSTPHPVSYASDKRLLYALVEKIFSLSDYNTARILVDSCEKKAPTKYAKDRMVVTYKDESVYYHSVNALIRF